MQLHPPSPPAASPPRWQSHPEAWAQELAQELDALASPEELQAWLQARGAGRWLRATLHQLGQVTGQATWSVQPVYAAFARTWSRQEVIGLLVRVLLEHEKARAWAERRRAAWERPPEEEAFRPAWEMLRAALPETLPEVLEAERLVCAELDPPSLVHSASHHVLELAPLRTDATDPRALVAFLDLVAGPESPPLCEQREALLKAATVPRSHRDLAVLVQALAQPEAPDEASGELGWLVHLTDHCSVRPLRCRPRKAGGYVTKALPASPPANELPPLTPTDELALSHVTHSARLDALVGHPLVFVQQGDEKHDGMPRVLRRGRLGLRLTPTEPATGDPATVAALSLELDGQGLEPAAVMRPYRVDNAWVVHPLPHSIVLARLPAAVATVAELLERRGSLVVPSGGHLLGALPSLPERVPVAADPGVLGVPVEPDVRPLIRIHPTPDGVFVEARVQPLGEAPSQVPGQGSSVLVGERDGALVHVQRSLRDEPAAVEAAVAPLGLSADQRDGFRWHLPQLEEALELAWRVRDPSLGVKVSWSGERLVLVPRTVEPDDLSLQIRRDRDWFGVAGGADVEGLPVGLAVLLRAARDGRRWLDLGPAQWARMSDDLVAKLRLLAAGLPAHEPRLPEEALQLTAVHAPLIQTLEDAGAVVEASPDWTVLARAQADSESLEISIPGGLRATLRPYQEEGFRWMARLASWAPGACLADDMGLGKTVQAAALLLHRSESPSLVVAPTSLLPNWERELARFAPGLVVRRFHGPDRELLVAPGAVTLTTYGVLSQDADALQAHSFGTVVLDEAHAIKNPTSQRAEAAHGLNARFRLALTGTPVENRTDELWSLFRFVCPGLLGSVSSFRVVFAGPIERGDSERREVLSRLVAPFLLRRTKSVVAGELPERIDVEHRISLTGEEHTLYERERLVALERLKQAPPHQRSVVVLTELQRLRQLACHPRMSDPSSPIESSKLAAAVRLIHELRAAGHRALLFSSFVKHLALVREALEAEGIRYRYLDGSMSPAERLREVDAFQGGLGDVFLVSLLAGGTGLNLTAATYVIHLDPWWNPAVEDQASDRAHRLGQTEPVTVVRLVAVGTLEERILDLHREKRALAQALLAGADQVDQRLDVEALAELLAEAPATGATRSPVAERAGS